MKISIRFWRSLFFLVLIAALCGGLAIPFLAPVRAAPQMQAATNVVISEIQTRGLGGVNDEFVELYNPTGLPIDINGWTIRKSSGCGALTEILVTISLVSPLNPGQHYLAAAFSYSGTTIPDYRHPSNWAMDDSGGIAVFDNSAALIDQVGMCGTTLYLEGTSLPPLSGTSNQSYDRNSDVSGSCQDTNNNLSDFFLRISIDPQNLTSPVTLCGNPTPTPTLTSTATNTATSTPTPTITPTSTITSTPSTLATTIVISEFRFIGTAGASDEFIELYNPTTASVSISGWTIRRSSGCGNTTGLIATIPALVTLAAGQHYLIGGPTYSGTITPDQPNVSLGIANDGGIALFNGTTIVDQVGLCASTLYREGTALIPLTTNTNRSYDRKSGALGNCLDSGNNLLDFFLRNPSDPQNSASPVTICGNPTPTPLPSTATPVPTKFRTATSQPLPPQPLIAINEFVPRPGHDWNNDGVINIEDEFIEIINHGTISVNLNGYSLDDEVNLGSDLYRLPSVTLEPGERIVFYGSETGLLLSDGGDGVRLLKPNGQLADAFNYTVVNYLDQSYCRLPDNGGLDDWNENCFPTPGLGNSVSGDFVTPPSPADDVSLCPIADTLPDDFILAECQPFGNNIWRRSYWDDTGWLGEQKIPGNPGKWDVFVD